MLSNKSSDQVARGKSHHRSFSLGIKDLFKEDFLASMFTKSESKESSSAKTHKRSASLDIKELTKDDFKSLQDKDPFMYHSIPGVRKATMSGKDASYSRCCGRRNSVSTTMKKTDTTVRRRSRISFEADATFLMGLFLEEEGDNIALALEGNDSAAESVLNNEAASGVRSLNSRAA